MSKTYSSLSAAQQQETSMLLSVWLCVDIQVFNGKATWKQLAQNWSVSYVGNMIGTFLIVTLMTQGAVFPQMASGPINTAMPKVGLTFSQVNPSQPLCLLSEGTQSVVFVSGAQPLGCLSQVC